MEWDLTSYFAEFDGQDYQDFKRKLTHDLELLENQLDSMGSISGDNLSDWVQ